MEVVILAGGFGTRLMSVITGIPKPMAPVRNIPFLKYIFDYLGTFEIERVVLSVGFRHEVIEEFFGASYSNISIDYCIENSPLGTGGAIKKSLEMCNEEAVIVLNGDTFFNIDLLDFYAQHQKDNAEISLALKPMENFERYGKVITDQHKIVAFSEKEYSKSGDINGGVYALKKDVLRGIAEDKFSFEKDFLEAKINKLVMTGYKYNEYFIDIGVPQDYEKAQKELLSFFKLR